MKLKKKQYQKEKMSRKNNRKNNTYCTAKPNPEPNETETSNKSKPQTKHLCPPSQPRTNRQRHGRPNPGHNRPGDNSAALGWGVNHRMGPECWMNQVVLCFCVSVCVSAYIHVYLHINVHIEYIYIYMGVSENSVPLNPMVNDHYPY